MEHEIRAARTSRSPAGFAVAFAFAVVIALIADLDRPQEGILSTTRVIFEPGDFIARLAAHFERLYEQEIVPAMQRRGSGKP